MSLRSVTLALMGGATGLEGVKLPRLLLQGEGEDSIEIQIFLKLSAVQYPSFGRWFLYYYLIVKFEQMF